MKVILFGATGMIGQGALRECLLDPGVEAVLAVGRRPTGQRHEKLRELVREDLFDLSPVEAGLAGFDACLFCLGVSSAGMDEAAYRRVTRDLTLSVAATVLKASPAVTFLYVSGAGTDATGRGRTMWARVKGETENALLAMPFRSAYMLRPGYIQPVHGVTSRTGLYRALYAVAGPLYPLWRALFPRQVTTTERLGRAMLLLARNGAPRRVLETADLEALLPPGGPR
ncbi:NAD-dependent epimerase/dehydratase family protein [Acidobacteria bacterium ACD]|nr:MAG: NAD-dependent epimerase/dehydratase family protein [Acidobacteriota bacterium]MCE7959044.1 NAD-dependent epimerase/dehydratase family protein [Acidobacteria bacterium ACB2]MDL1951993.1 NAD-dependent epimerase/dehydratase family protein [Acidobacteria bacterium ACD]